MIQPSKILPRLAIAYKNAGFTADPSKKVVAAEITSVTTKIGREYRTKNSNAMFVKI